MNKATYSVLLLITVWLPISGQKIIPTPDDLYSDGIEFMYSGDYNDALFLFLNLNDRGYNSPDLNYKIGECYLNIQGQKTRSIPFLKEAVKKMSEEYKGNSLQEEYAPYKALLYLGIACRLDYDFENATLNFNNYMHSLKETDKENIKLAEYHLERCNYARELMAAPAKFAADTITDIFNSNISSFNPLVTPDERLLYFMNQLKFYDAVMQSVKSDTGWRSPDNLTPLIKSDGDHYITGLSADGNQLFLTNYDPYQTGEIFTSMYKDGQWSDMQKLNSNINTRYNETHASLSPDSQTLYFTSDRKGGYGGLDIYRSVKANDGDWGKAVNLGPLINTPFNEESPFVSSDGTKLFFSSQGHYNMGGYDVFFSSKGDEGNWLPPVNIGYPLNTTDDDLFFFPLDSGRVAYQSRFSSLSAKMGIIRYVIDSYGKPARFVVNGTIDLEGGSGVRPEDISVSFIDNKLKDTLATRSLNEDGTFRQKLPAGSYTLDFIGNNKTLLARELNIPAYSQHNNLVFHDKIVFIAPDVSDTLYIRDIRFDFNASNPYDTYLADLERLAGIMLKYPQITVQVNGYADAMGSDSYNMKLSLIRAERVKEYLDKRTDSMGRITVKGFGEADPVALNVNDDGTDNPDGRKFNRRAEISISNIPDALIIIKVKDIPVSLMQK